MKTRVVKVGAAHLDACGIKEAASILRKGGIAAIPTETVYGLAVNAQDKKALARLYAIKKRARSKPLTVQISGLSQLKRYVESLPKGLRPVLKKFWPGPLTIIVQGKNGSIGLRMPDNKTALSIIKKAKVPLAVTSANMSGEPPARSAEEVIKNFNGLIDMVIDDGVAAKGIESTVLDCTASPFKIVRKGAISEELKRFLK